MANSKDIKALGVDLRNFKAELDAIGIAKEVTGKLDGFASQVENFAAEVAESEPAEEQEEAAELPTGKLAPSSGTEPTVKTGAVDAQTQLDSQKGKDDPNVPNVSTISAEHGKTSDTVVKNSETAAKRAEDAKK